jgi:GNAT superfamily N-acetyltransferase
MDNQRRHAAKDLEIKPVALEDILRLRDMHRQEMNCQIRNDSYHVRGFTSLYLLLCGGRTAGYGCVGDYDSRGKDIVTEFYVTPPYRSEALPLFRALITVTGATRIEAQTNDRLMTLMLYDCCRLDSITSDTILFEDTTLTNLPAPEGIVFRRIPVEESGNTLQCSREDIVAEAEGAVIGKSGFLTHYNPPYGDVWMEVDEGYRNRGIGSYLVQEAKRVCYEAGRRPAARCNVTNVASRQTLQRGGFLPCARLLIGTIME